MTIIVLPWLPSRFKTQTDVVFCKREPCERPDNLVVTILINNRSKYIREKVAALCHHLNTDPNMLKTYGREEFVSKMQKHRGIADVCIVPPHDLRKSARMRNLSAKDMPPILRGLSVDINKRRSLLRPSVIASIVKGIIDNNTAYIDAVTSVLVAKIYQRLI